VFGKERFLRHFFNAFGQKIPAIVIIATLSDDWIIFEKLWIIPCN